VSFQQVPEIEDGGLIRIGLAAEIDADELAHSLPIYQNDRMALGLWTDPWRRSANDIE
jgi:hypothetical protein